MTFRSSSSAFFILVWWVQGFISASFTMVLVVRSMSQGPVHFSPSWLSGDVVTQILSSTLSAGSKKCRKPVGEKSLIWARSFITAKVWLQCSFSLPSAFLIYMHTSYPNFDLKWPPVHNFIGIQLNITQRNHPYLEHGNRLSLIPMEMSFLAQPGYIFLYGVIHLL